MKRFLLLLCGLLLMPMIVAAQEETTELVNLTTCAFTQPVTIDDSYGVRPHLFRIPEYEWVDAAGEGLSAVDDAARGGRLPVGI